MIKKYLTFLFLIGCFMINLDCIAKEHSDSNQNPIFYDLETNKNFIVDYSNSDKENLRICVPILYPEWFVVPLSCIDKVDETEKKVIDGQNFTFVHIQFKNEYPSLNSLLKSFQKLIYNEREVNANQSNKRWGWRPPWFWSSCAKCRLGVNSFLTLSVIGAAAAAGTTGPGAWAVWKAAIIGKYELTAWKAIEAGIFNLGIDVLSKQICESQGKCN